MTCLSIFRKLTKAEKLRRDFLNSQLDETTGWRRRFNDLFGIRKFNVRGGEPGENVTRLGMIIMSDLHLYDQWTIQFRGENPIPGVHCALVSVLVLEYWRKYTRPSMQPAQLRVVRDKMTKHLDILCRRATPTEPKGRFADMRKADVECALTTAVLVCAMKPQLEQRTEAALAHADTQPFVRGNARN